MTDEVRNAGRDFRALAGKLAPGTWQFKVSLIAAAVAIAALTVAPFFRHIPSTPSGRVVTLRLLSTHDLNEHLVVMEQFDKSLRSGVLYPRWLPDVNGGYGDNSKVDALIQSGRALRVTNDTRVRVLSSGTGKTRVRIIEGEHSMVEGWVPERWVR